MFFWKGLSIRTKVVAAFTVVLAAAIAMGAFGLSRTAAVNDAALDVRDNWLPSTVAIGKLALGVENYRIKEARYILALLSRNDVAIADAATDFQTGETIVSKDRSDYQLLVTLGTDDERLMREFDEAWVKTKQSSSRVIALAKTGDVGTTFDLYRGEDKQNFDAALEKAKSDLAFNGNEGRKAGTHGAEVYSGAFWMTPGESGELITVR